MQHIAIQRVDGGIAHVGRGHAFAEVIEHNNARRAAQPVKLFLMQFGPDACARADREEFNGGIS
jgi:hypothetical protein